jgi:CubicO group peptidase (beta-lactamase class C family)
VIDARFRAQHAAGRFPGGQLAVVHRGVTVADVAVGLASGYREGEPRVEVASSTLFPVFSVSKPFVAVAIALLEERGLLELNAPLSRYVPEWPADRTVLDVLTHRTGILLPEVVADETRWGDRAGLVRAVAQTPPKFPRGTLAYAPYEYGWMLAEIFERAAGEPLPQFLEREFLKPAGIDVRFTTDSTEVARNYWLGPKHVVAGVELATRWEAVHNNPATRATFVPGAGMVATASALARFYALLLDGGRGLIKPETIRAYTTLNVGAYDRSNRLPLRIGRGFLLGAPFPSVYGYFGTSGCFGHAGAFCAVGGADPKTGIALAWITNANRGPYDLLLRSMPLWAAARAALR